MFHRLGFTQSFRLHLGFAYIFFPLFRLHVRLTKLHLGFAWASLNLHEASLGPLPPFTLQLGFTQVLPTL